MTIRAIIFDVNGTLIDINTDEGNEQIYRAISHFLKYHGIYTNRNEVREGVTVHRAADEDGVTSVGDDNLLMACAHVAHNCHIGNQVVMANYAGLAGHAVVEDQAILGGLSGVHQFVRIGRLCMVGGLAKITKDLPPFAIVDGNPARIYGLNSRGLRRRGVAESARLALKRSFRLLTMAGLNLEQALAAIRSSQLDCPEVAHLVDFLEAPTRMGVLTRSCGDRRQKCAEVLEPDPRDSDRGAC